MEAGADGRQDRGGRRGDLAFVPALAASALISGGASVKQVQTFLGHASAVVTLRIYAHMWPGDDDRTRSIIDAILSPPKDSARTEKATDG